MHLRTGFARPEGRAECALAVGHILLCDRHDNRASGQACLIQREVWRMMQDWLLETAK